MTEQPENAGGMPVSRRALLGAGGAASVAGLIDALPAGMARLEDFLTADQRLATRNFTAGPPVDCTAAFTAALGEGRRVAIGPGHYGLDGLRLPSGSGLTGTGGVMLHQLSPLRPAIDCTSDKATGHMSGVVVEGIELTGHPQAVVALVRVGARGAYAVWRSRFAFYARNCFRALEIEGADAANVFESQFEVVCEGTRSTAVLVTGGVYNRLHLFLTQTQGWALDDSSAASEIRLVAENCAIFRGQNNRVAVAIEGIAAARAADPVAVTDRGFGNTFLVPVVNMPARDGGKLTYAFRAFERTVFLNPQIIGPGVPPHPFAPTAVRQPFTVIGGRSNAANRMEATFDGSHPDRDLGNVTFVGDVSDYTALATRAGAVNVQRFTPAGDFTAAIAQTTGAAIIDAARPLGRVRLAFALPPRDGWRLDLTTNHAIAALDWPDEPRYAALPRTLAARAGLRLVYHGASDRWYVLG